MRQGITTSLNPPEWKHCKDCLGWCPVSELEADRCAVCRLALEKKADAARVKSLGLPAADASLLGFAAMRIQRVETLLGDIRAHMYRLTRAELTDCERHEHDALIERITEEIGPGAPSSKGETVEKP